MRVRAARNDDTEAMALVMAAVAEEGSIGTEPPVDVAALARRFQDTLNSSGGDAMWVLEADGRIVGVAGAHESGPRGVLSLGMALVQEARGQGGGRALVEAIFAHARSSGAHKVQLEVWTDNARAISLYAAAGFEVEGLRRDHYLRRDGSLRSTLIMARRLA